MSNPLYFSTTGTVQGRWHSAQWNASSTPDWGPKSRSQNQVLKNQVSFEISETRSYNEVPIEMSKPLYFSTQWELSKADDILPSEKCPASLPIEVPNRDPKSGFIIWGLIWDLRNQVLQWVCYWDLKTMPPQTYEISNLLYVSTMEPSGADDVLPQLKIPLNLGKPFG
jgi:hypothetical protein